MELTQSCTGCMACYNRCPNDAISIIYSKEGFYVPHIDKEKCTNCGLCTSVCPQMTKEINKEEPKVCYAVMANDEIRKNSASGGVFAMFAQEYLKNGGYVCGAAFTDDFKHIHHIVIDKQEDLIKLQNSKYVQSNIGKILSEIKKLLDDKKEVLFSGTPCQIAGLNNYLGKTYDNLLTIDLVCHGIPSPLLWEKYIDEIAAGRKVLKASFRNKKYTWHASQHLEFVLQKKFFGTKTISDTLFYRAFLEHLIINDTCCECKYTNLKRHADITVADFWGIDQIDTDMDDAKGTSLLIINSLKGEKIFNTYKHQFIKFKEFDIRYAKLGNPRLFRPSEPHISRKNFVKNLHKMPVLQNIKEGLCPKYEGIIRNFWAYNNFGATLSAYAIQRFFQNKGKDYYILQTHYPVDYTKPFADKYLKTTHLVYSDTHFKELNKCTDNFVIGTDQVLRSCFMEGHIGKDLYGYTDFGKNRISFSGSFGLNKLENMGWLSNLKYSKLIKRFDAISTRELSGIDICKKEFNMKADCIIDPVFLIDKDEWLNMAPNTNDKYKKKIVCYIFDIYGAQAQNVQAFLEQKYNAEVVMLTNAEIPIEEFLSAIKDADALVTNSFHGTCFALIFNKKLLAVTNTKAGDSRFESLIKIFGIQDMTVQSIEDIYKKEELFAEYDYTKFYNILEQERKKANIWFDKNVNSKKKITLKKILAEIDYKIFLNIEKFLNFLVNVKFYYLCRKNNAGIVLWGASIYLDNLLAKNPKIAKNILGIIDKNPARYYKKFHGCTVYPPEKLAELKPKMVISTVKNNHEKVYMDIKKYMQENYPNIELLQDIFN